MLQRINDWIFHFNIFKSIYAHFGCGGEGGPPSFTVYSAKPGCAVLRQVSEKKTASETITRGAKPPHSAVARIFRILLEDLKLKIYLYIF